MSTKDEAEERGESMVGGVPVAKLEAPAGWVEEERWARIPSLIPC
jgi:hypothetical protein